MQHAATQQDQKSPKDQKAIAAQRNREEKQLMQRIASQQDRKAYEKVYRRYNESIHHFLCAKGIDSMTAEDITQDVMYTVWNKAASYESSKSSLSNWIYTIARNKAIDLFRHNGRVRQVEFDEYRVAPNAEPQADDSVEDTTSDAQRHDQVIRSLSHLSRKQRHVMYLSYFQGQSHSVISQYLNIPIGTVKSRVRLALKSLRADEDLHEFNYST